MSFRANRLRELRMESGKSQEVVSGFACIAQPTYSAYENGRSIPSDKLISLAVFFNVSLEYLLGMTDDKHSCSISGANSKVNSLVSFYESLSGRNKIIFDNFIETLKNMNDDE